MNLQKNAHQQNFTNSFFIYDTGGSYEIQQRKKTIIHLLSIIMAISAVVASSLLVSAQSAATIENNYARLMQLQANAVAANECLNESFGHDAIGNITFPDDFAGARIEEDKLVLSLTDTTAENKAKYIRWAGDYADYLLFET